MPTGTVTIHEVADRLGVGVTTIRTWSERLGILGAKTSGGKRVYSESDVTLFEIVKSLRAEDAGIDTIRRRIGRDTDAHSELADGNNQQTDDKPFATEAIAVQVIEAIRADNDLARQYAQAAHQIGRLEAQVERLQQDLDSARLALTDGGQACEALNQQLMEKDKALAVAETRAQDLQARVTQFEEERQRPWWRRLLG